MSVFPSFGHTPYPLHCSCVSSCCHPVWLYTPTVPTSPRDCVIRPNLSWSACSSQHHWLWPIAEPVTNVTLLEQIKLKFKILFRLFSLIWSDWMKLKTFRIRNNIIKILQKWPSLIAMHVVNKPQLHVYAIYPWWLIDNNILNYR